jgi:hypothetical protein
MHSLGAIVEEFSGPAVRTPLPAPDRAPQRKWSHGHGRRSDTSSRPRVLPKLLHRPLRRRMGGHMALQDPSRSDFEHHKHIKQLEFGRDCHHEVTSDYRIGMIAHECRPVLGRSSSRSMIIPLRWPVLADGSRGHENGQLERELRRHSPLAPSRILQIPPLHAEWESVSDGHQGYLCAPELDLRC